MNIAACDRIVDAPVDIVWRLVSTPDGLTEWMAASAEVDLRPGGTIRWTHDNGWIVAGEVCEVVPLRRLVFTYGWERGGFPVPVGSSVVTIELTAIGESTEVRVRHEGLTAAMSDRHSRGWAIFADRLAGQASSIARGVR